MIDRRLFALLGAAALLAGCDEDSPLPTLGGPGTGGGDSTALVRAVNASAATATADVLVDGVVVATAVPFGAAGAQCVAVPAGARTVEFRAGGRTVATTSRTLGADGVYSVVLTGADTAARAATVLDDAVAQGPLADEAALRFFNATAESGQVFASTPTGPLPDLPIAQVAAGGASGFVVGPAANRRARLYPSITIPALDPPIADVTIDALPDDRTGTVYFTGASTASAATGFFVPSCG